MSPLERLHARVRRELTTLDGGEDIQERVLADKKIEIEELRYALRAQSEITDRYKKLSNRLRRGLAGRALSKLRLL